MNNLDSIKFFLPEIVLTGGVLVIILFELITSYKKLLPYLSLWILVVAFFCTANLLVKNVDASIFENLIRINGFTTFFKLLFTLASFITILFSLSRRQPHHNIEYYSLLLIVTLGLYLLASANDLLIIYLGLETVSISSYLLTSSQKGIRRSAEAGLKYLIFGAIASGIMLYGMSLLYGLYGTTSLETLFALIQRDYYQPVLLASLFMVFIGLGYKIAVVPVHMWCPDVYEGAPTEITGFLSVAPKAAGFAIIIRFFYKLLQPLTITPLTVSDLFLNNWQWLFAVISVVTMTLGNLAALHQTNLKRLLAYSSIAHAGYILMGLVVMQESGIQAMVLYLPIYLFMNMGAFFVIYIIENITGSVDIDKYEGLGWRLPFIGVVMSIFLFSLIGLPPLGGFIAKLYIFASVIEAKWYLLALVGLLNGVVSLYYYARIIRAMFLKIPTEELKNGGTKELPVSSSFSPSVLSLFDTILLMLLVIPVLILGVYFTPLVNLINRVLGV
ncbi:MAG: NADH-quinone oxidoreductase subunit N [Planctomycetota bacterium]|nr:NADH-quinone oxidoreductase subunit N [Planctomycetota bacterium]MDI6787900.1 NADH-quinone oxidoreductase subunit N [Planctomycetota bacterium]